MQPVAESVFKQILTYKKFWLYVIAPDPAHVEAPYLGFLDVSHGGNLWFTKVVICNGAGKSTPTYSILPVRAYAKINSLEEIN
jgi:hypothetical protein